MPLTKPTQPAAVDAVPTPVPQRSDMANFAVRGDTMMTWFPTGIAGINTNLNYVAAACNFIEEQNTLAQTALTDVNTALSNAVTAKNAAEAAALTAINAPGTSGTSTTSLAVGTGAKACTTQTGKAWAIGQQVTLARTSDPVNIRMVGIITAYDAGTGALTVSVSSTTGSGTFTDWTISLSATAAGLRLQVVEYTANGTFTPSAKLIANGGGVHVLAVGGGGGGGGAGGTARGGGGGGGGAVRYGLLTILTAQTVTIGAGGTAGAGAGSGGVGGTTSIGSFTALGGGGGGTTGVVGLAGANGGGTGGASTEGGGGGGGAAGPGGVFGLNGGPPTWGFPGGSANTSISTRGGGAGIDGFGGGGGGGGPGDTNYGRGNSGGGNGGSSNGAAGSAGTANTGGGGGGGNGANTAGGGAGGSGFVRVWWYE